MDVVQFDQSGLEVVATVYHVADVFVVLKSESRVQQVPAELIKLQNRQPDHAKDEDLLSVPQNNFCHSLPSTYINKPRLRWSI